MRRLPALILAFALAGGAAAETPVPEAVRAAAADLESGRVQQGLTKLEALAAKGDGWAGTLLSEIFLLGLFDLPRDAKRGCDYAERFRDIHPESAHNYGQCVFDGEGRPKDLAQARVWYGKAFDAGFHQSGCALGNMYIFGWGGPEEPQKGFALCLKAAEAGQKDAQADVGNYYLQGRGTAQDYVKARAWYLKAAEQGQANAAYILAQMHWNGDGGPKDRDQAARWWKVAYEKGRPDAALQLGNWEVVQFSAALKANRQTNLDGLDRAIVWFEKALAESSDPDVREKASEGLAVSREAREGLRKK